MNFSRITTNTADGNMSFIHGTKESVTAHRKHALQKHSISLDDCAVMRVIDQNIIHRVTATDRGRGARQLEGAIIADALVTQEKNIFLFLLTADCLPLTLFDPVGEVIGLAHLGRKSSDKMLTEELVSFMQQEFGTQPSKLRAYFGPAIHAQSYLLDPEKIVFTSDWSAHTRNRGNNRISVDILGFNEEVLQGCGLQITNIFHDLVDTATSSEHYSHYRSVKTGEPEGRFATVAGIRLV